MAPEGVSVGLQWYRVSGESVGATPTRRQAPSVGVVCMYCRASFVDMLIVLHGYKLSLTFSFPVFDVLTPHTMHTLPHHTHSLTPTHSHPHTLTHTHSHTHTHTHSHPHTLHRLVTEFDKVCKENQTRMSHDPFELMVMRLGVNMAASHQAPPTDHTHQDDSDGNEEEDGSGVRWIEDPRRCRQSWQTKIVITYIIIIFIDFICCCVQLILSSFQYQSHFIKPHLLWTL